MCDLLRYCLFCRSDCSQHASLPFAEVQNQLHQSKQQPLRHKRGAAQTATATHNHVTKGSAENSSQPPHQQESLMSTATQMAAAVQQSHAAVASSVAEAAFESHSVARLASTAAQPEVTPASSAAQSEDNLPATALPTFHVGPLCMSPAASASGLSAAESASQHAAAESASPRSAPESASQPTAAETAPQHALDDSASLHTAACATGQSQSSAAGSMPQANRSWRSSARAGLVQGNLPLTKALGQTDMPQTKALVQTDMPLIKALVQRDMPLTKALVQSSGTGCEDVLEMSEAVSRVRQRDSWVSRSFRGKVQSSCTLQLRSKSQHGVSVKV